MLVARVCPFDPAYPAFVELCRRCAGNRWLPRVELTARLDGGGSVTFLEFAAPVEPEVAAQVAGCWRAGTGDAEFRETTPWWDGLDLNSDHIRRAADGRLVLIDIFRMDGASLYAQILTDIAEVHNRLPRERMRYALEIPYIARESSAAQISALKHAWARDV